MAAKRKPYQSEPEPEEQTTDEQQQDQRTDPTAEPQNDEPTNESEVEPDEFKGVKTAVMCDELDTIDADIEAKRTRRQRLGKAINNRLKRKG